MEQLQSILTDLDNKAITKHQAYDLILVLFDVVWRSEQLPPNPITDKEHKELKKTLYPKDNSKRFRR
jgi:hypothetical protein